MPAPSRAVPRCYARWTIRERQGICFRDQTWLQFGTSWAVLANVILLNPGSARPLNTRSQTAFLRQQNLPLLVDPNGAQDYHQFSIDRLMHDLFGAFSRAAAGGGVIRIFNLFNLRQPQSRQAIVLLDQFQNDPAMFCRQNEMRFGAQPVVIATGKMAFSHPRLRSELRTIIARASRNPLYTLSRVAARRFAFLPAHVCPDGLADSFHPAHTFRYGNRTASIDHALVSSCAR